MDFSAHFDAFLASTVNLKEYKLDLLDARVAAITAAFQRDDVMGDQYGCEVKEDVSVELVERTDRFNNRLVRPGSLPEMLFVLEWEDDPKTYLREVR